MKKIAPTVVYFLLYVALVGLTPWKIAPYTDTYGLVFPIMSVYFYLCYREARKEAAKYLLMALALVSAAAGGLIKPSVYLLLVAILFAESLRFMQDWKKKWKYMLFEALLIIGLFAAKGVFVNHMIEDLGLHFNKELEASWQHYFHMGQNEETTGAYSGDDSYIFVEFQESRKDRDAALWERGIARVKEKGLVGNLSFWLKKMMMVFNDGTFNWKRAHWTLEWVPQYPEDLARNDNSTQLLRDIFWQDMIYTEKYNTFCQLVWMFCLSGLVGFCFLTAEKRKDCVILAICFLGIFFYQMLFEASPRYLLVFAPLLCVISIRGMWQYVEWGEACLEQRIRRMNGRSKENAP